MREASTLQPHQSTEIPGAPATTEARLAALVGGAALMTLAARDRSWRGIGFALAGAPLVWRGATGSWPVSRGGAADTGTERLHQTQIQTEPKPISTSVTIDKPRQELYAFWRQLENLPKFMRHLESVEEHGGGRSHWEGKSPVGLHVKWEAEIVDEQEGHHISWQSLPGSRIFNAGTVYFEDAPGNRGTVVRVKMEASPSGVGRVVGRVLSPMTERQVHEDLRRFKSLMEAGEIPTTDGQPAGKRSALNPHNPF